MDEGEPVDLDWVFGGARVAGWVYEADEPGYMHERVHIWVGTMPDEPGREGQPPRWWVKHTAAVFEGPSLVFRDKVSAWRGVRRMAARLVARRAPGRWFEMDPVRFEVRRDRQVELDGGPGGGVPG